MEEALTDLSLFKGFSPGEIPGVLSRLGAVRRSFRRGVVISHEHMRAEWLLLVLAGRVNLYDGALNGERHLMCTVTRGGLLGTPLLADVSTHCLGLSQAAEPSEVLLFSLAKLREFKAVPELIPFYGNLHSIVAIQLMRMYQKCAILSCKTVPGRIMLYLSILQGEQRSNHVTLPWSHREFAEFLGINRSFLSSSFTMLKKQGRIDYKGREVTILDDMR